MSVRLAVLAAIVSVCMNVTYVAQAFRPAGAAAASIQQSTDKSDAVFAANCLKCHPAEKVVATRRSRLQWEEVINTMVTTRGAQVSDDDYPVVLDYLVHRHGRVEINRAPAVDLADVLEITESTAAAIVKYRDEHGAFKDFDALLKVPGVDATALEKKREAIVF
jgi:competence ComEA-like helix-hairpin-helix protein